MDSMGRTDLIERAVGLHESTTPAEAFEMPLDYDKARRIAPCELPANSGAIDRADGRGLGDWSASPRCGIAGKGDDHHVSRGARRSCGITQAGGAKPSQPASQTPVQQPVVASVTASE